MRSACWIAALLIAGCAHEPLAAHPPPGVDLSGHWRLDAAESDDPQRVVGLVAGFGGGAGPDRGGDDPQRRGGGDEHGGDGERGGGAEASERAPPTPAAIGTLAQAMQWPGPDLVIKQVGGVAAFSSGGESRVYQPSSAARAGERAESRRGASTQCGWSGDALLVFAAPDDDGPPLELRYQVSADRRRLIERIARSGAGTRELALTRVWDLVP